MYIEVENGEGGKFFVRDEAMRQNSIGAAGVSEKCSYLKVIERMVICH